MVLKNFDIAQMRSTVTFKVNAPTTAATGDRLAIAVAGLNDSYSTLLVTRGRLRKRNGQRNLLTGIIEDKEQYELICRFQSGVENNLRVDTKVDIKNFRYTIDTWEKVDEIGHWYKFILNVAKQFAKNSTPITDGSYGPSTYGVFKLQKTLIATEFSVQDADLIADSGNTVTILMLAREGTVLTEGTHFTYDQTTGIITFTEAGNPLNENIEIVFKIA